MAFKTALRHDEEVYIHVLKKKKAFFYWKVHEERTPIDFMDLFVESHQS